MSILKSNNANFKISLQWLLDKGWEAYSFDIEQTPNLLRMSKHAPYLDGVHLNVYLSSDRSDSEIVRIMFVKEYVDGTVLYRDLDTKNKEMMNYLFS